MDLTALFKLSYGLYIISSSDDGNDAGCVVNTLQQVTASPVQVSVAIHKDNETRNVIERAGRFDAVVLSEHMDMETIGTFGFQSSRDIDKFKDVSYQRGQYEIPFLNQQVAAHLACRVVQTLDIGTHILFIAEVEEAEKLGNENVMTYAYYHQVKNGMTPKNASSYQEPTEKKSGWRCSVCGYIYEGDILPDDFICPICHQPASVFEKL